MELPGHAYAYELTSAGVSVITHEKTAVFRGRRCRVTEFEIQSFGEHGLEPVSTALIWPDETQ